jgi:hypothetical protein
MTSPRHVVTGTQGRSQRFLDGDVVVDGSAHLGVLSGDGQRPVVIPLSALTGEPTLSLLGPTVRRERPILLLSAVATLSGLTVSGRESTIVPSARPNGERLDRPVLGSWIDAQGLPQMIVNRGVNHVNSTFSTRACSRFGVQGGCHGAAPTLQRATGLHAYRSGPGTDGISGSGAIRPERSWLHDSYTDRLLEPVQTRWQRPDQQ